MRGPRQLFVVLAFVAVVCAWSAAGALADNGCNSSAGDSQYVDPLANCNQSGGGHSGGTSGQASTPPTTVEAPTSTTPTATIAATTTSSSTQSKDPLSKKSLPFTGLDLGPALIVAVGLLASGLALRRLVGDARDQ